MLAKDRFKQDLLDIVAGASTISERLDGDFVPVNTSAGDEIANARLERWCQISTGGDESLFKKLLELESLTIRGVRRVLGSVKLSQEAFLPDWAYILHEVLSFTDALSDNGPEDDQLSASRLLDTSEFVPFGEVVAPFVLIARQHLREQSGETFHLLSDEAHLTLQRELLRSLVSTSLDTLQLRSSQARWNSSTTASIRLPKRSEPTGASGSLAK